MRDHSACDFDAQLLRDAMTKLEDLPEPYTDEEHELRAECSALMGRLVRLRNRLDKGDAAFVSSRVDALYAAVNRCVACGRGRGRRPSYSPVGPTRDSGAPGAA